MQIFRMLLAVAGLWIGTTGLWANPADPDVSSFNEVEVKQRIEAMPCLVEPKYTTAVKGYLMGYTVRSRVRAEHIIGRSVIYFPMIEQFLREKNLPQELKYLPIVESALRPDAVSRAGAKGLWQFMDYTGREYGLKINRWVDERYDPVKSTQAALTFLTGLYNRFDSWELALASYNAGGGRVSRAVKRARSKNFWRVQRYLPLETRNYVPAFIAATYLMKHYPQHQMYPVYPGLDYQLTEIVMVYDQVSLWKVAQITSLPIEIIQDLNPAYQRGYIPANRHGNFLVLPSRAVQSMKNFLDYKELDGSLKQGLHELAFYQLELDRSDSHPHYYKSSYVVKEGEQVEDLAAFFNCSPNHIIAWNELRDHQLYDGQKLVIYYPKKALNYSPLLMEDMPVLKKAPRPVLSQAATPSALIRDGYLVTDKKYQAYLLLRVLTLEQVAAKFPEIEAGDLVLLNNQDTNQPIRPGTKIRLWKK